MIGHCTYCSGGGFVLHVGHMKHMCLACHLERYPATTEAYVTQKIVFPKKVQTLYFQLLKKADKERAAIENLEKLEAARAKLANEEKASRKKVRADVGSQLLEASFAQ